MSQSNNLLPARVDKALQWLESSRNSWKKKTLTSKYELKKQKIAVKRAREQRNSISKEFLEEKTAHCKALDELKQKETEIAKLQAQLQHANQQAEELKKKQLHRSQKDRAITPTGIAL